MDTVRVAVADDSALFREGIALLLAAAGVEVALQARTGLELLAYLRTTPVDVAILDIRMPPTYTDEGIVAAHEIRDKYPGTGVLVLSTYAESAHAMRLLGSEHTAVGYLLKDRVDDVPALRQALERVHRQETVIDPLIVQRLVARQRSDDLLDQLTERERTVLQLMAEGRSNAGIAAELLLGTKTVERHIAGVFDRLGLTSDPSDNRRVLAVLRWMRGQSE